MFSVDRPSGRYRISSLDRGLSILKATHEADGPVRNREIVQRTGLPKATVSRLMGTLAAKGYLRRIDSRGTYVIGHASERTGRTMLGSLGLERHGPMLRNLFGDSSIAWLYARVSSRTVRAFRWSREGDALLATGAGDDAACACVSDCFDRHADDARKPTARCSHEWNDAARLLTVSAGLDFGTLAGFVLTVELGLPTRPSDDELEAIGQQLRQAANAIAADTTT